MSDRSAFRVWFEDWLRPLTGRRIQWPQLFRTIIKEEINRTRENGSAYEGDVFINRDSIAAEYANRTDQHREDLSVYRLYRLAHERQDGCILVGNEPVWLVSCKVPNQGKHRHRVADLLGVRPDGSIVVFECKVEGNKSDTPLFALLEGLDYLSHLMIEANFHKLQDGFADWSSARKHPSGFDEKLDLNSNGMHSVIVLAPEQYYEQFRTDSKSIEDDWEYLSDRYWPASDCNAKLDFAITDFTSGSCPFLSLMHLPS